MKAAVSLAFVLLFAFGGCPSTSTDNPPPGQSVAATSGIPAGTYTGDLTMRAVMTVDTEVLLDHTDTIASTAIFDADGRMLGLRDGTPLGAGHTGSYTEGSLTVTKTVTSVVGTPDSVVVQGTIRIDIAAAPGNPAIGGFHYTYKLVSSGALEYSELITATTSASTEYPEVVSFRYEYEGTITR